MSMPADAITAILALSPSHLWPMNEASGSTFADQVLSGTKNLTAAGGCTPNGWSALSGVPNLRGYRNNGGPQTPGTTFDGSTTGYASATGATVGGVGTYWHSGGTGSGLTLLMWMDSMWPTLFGQVLYAESSPTSTEQFVLWNSSNQLRLTYTDSGGTRTQSPLGNSANIFGGQSYTEAAVRSIGGGTLIGVTINPDGTVMFWRNGAKNASSTTSTVLPDPASWTSPSINTYLGYHPSVTSPGGSPTGFVAAAAQAATSVANGGANEAGSSLLQTNATSTTAWTQGLPILIGTDMYTVQKASILGSTVLVNLTSTLKVDITPGATITPVPYGAFRGALGWTMIFPRALTTAENYQVYQAICPEPAGAPAWTKAKSGAFFPGSQLWNEALDTSTPTTVDPNSAAIISYWNATATGNLYPQLTNLIPLIDIDQDTQRLNADGSVAAIRDDFYGDDQHAFLARMPVATHDDAEGPLPINMGSDAQSSVNSPKLGLNYVKFHQFTLAGRDTPDRAPVWHARVRSVGTSLTGTLAAGTYQYAASVVLANGDESSCVSMSNTVVTGAGLSSGLLTDTNVQIVLGATGAAQLKFYVDSPYAATTVPTKVRIYRRGPGSTTITDFQLLTEITTFALNIDVAFVDNGSFTPDPTIIPYGINGGVTSIIAQQGCLATFASGVTGPIGYTANIVNNTGVSADATTAVATFSAAMGAKPVAGARVVGPGIAAGSKVAVSPAPTQTQFWVTVATVSSQTAVKIHVGQWDPPMTLYGHAGKARGRDAAVAGGGGTWGWYGNEAFMPSFRPSNATYNGASATSCPEGAGFITMEEAINAANGDLHAIKHPLLIAIGVQIQSGVACGFRYPAKRHDGTDTSLSHLVTTREGMRMRFLPSFDPTTVVGLAADTQASNFQQALMYALRDYGMFIRDSTASTAFGVMYREDPVTSGRTSLGLFLGGLADAAGTPQILSAIPWNQLVVLSAFRYPAKTRALGTFTASLNSTTTTITSVSSFTNCYPGVIVTGNVPAGTTVFSVNPGASTAVLSANPTVTASGQTLTVSRRTNRLDAGVLGTPGFQQMVPH